MKCDIQELSLYVFLSALQIIRNCSGSNAICLMLIVVSYLTVIHFLHECTLWTKSVVMKVEPGLLVK